MAAGEQHGWLKSSYSNHQGACVEVALGGAGVSVRDSKEPASAVLTVDSRKWTAFVHRLKD
ncbi:DUF397 domain-containing protein [Actinopolyspora halophila]|uniref:DUF397 domain-containing protein n=1 Tax=Actinopolyspora halophila TaxID=1850 RepID=UPI0003683A8D|nr:DUF397 domain-containing protein [Actinopolyspora halophila]